MSQLHVQVICILGFCIALWQKIDHQRRIVFQYNLSTIPFYASFISGSDSLYIQSYSACRPTVRTPNTCYSLGARAKHACYSNHPQPGRCEASWGELELSVYVRHIYKVDQMYAGFQNSCMIWERLHFLITWCC